MLITCAARALSGLFTSASGDMDKEDNEPAEDAIEGLLFSDLPPLLLEPIKLSGLHSHPSFSPLLSDLFISCLGVESGTSGSTAPLQLRPLHLTGR